MNSFCLWKNKLFKSTPHQNFIILGNIIINMLVIPIGGASEKYIDLILGNDMLSLILRPTRVSATSATLIDHVWTKDITSVYNAGIIASHTTDHYPVYANFLSRASGVTDNHQYIDIYRRTFMEESRVQFRAALQLNDWNAMIDEFNDPQVSYSEFDQKLQSLYRNYFPLKQ